MLDQRTSVENQNTLEERESAKKPTDGFGVCSAAENIPQSSSRSRNIQRSSRKVSSTLHVQHSSEQRRQDLGHLRHHRVVERHCLCCASSRVRAARHTERHPRHADHKQLSDPQSKRPRPASAAFSCPVPEFLLTSEVPTNSCTAPRVHGRITHQPEDDQYGGFGPDLQCYPPLS